MDAITPDFLLRKYGSQAAIAKALDVTPGAVWQWFRAGEVPELRQYHVRDLMAREASQDSASATNAPESRVG